MVPPVRPRLLRIKDSVSQTCVLAAFVPAYFFLFFHPDLSGWNIIFFISLHSEWQFLKTAAQRGIFITFCAAAWESRQLSISLHLSSISLSHSGSLMPFSSLFPTSSLSFSPWQYVFFPPPRLTLLWPSCSDCPPCALFTVWDLQRIILHRRISRALSCPITCDRIPATRSSVFFYCWAAGDGKGGGGGGGRGGRSTSSSSGKSRACLLWKKGWNK